MITLIIMAVFVLVILKTQLNVTWCASHFEKGNVIIFGKKGKGKDVFMQAIINRRAKPYLANQDYGGKYRGIAIGEINTDPNDFTHMIHDDITPIPFDARFFKADAYVSDAGIYLPSHYDSTLDKNYKSMPIFYALSRQLYQNNIHVNTQALSRVWIKLREQADSYFLALKTVRLPLMLFVKVRYYDQYESAKQSLLPFKVPFLTINGHMRALKAQFDSTNGIIKEKWVSIFKFRVNYDTYAFREKMFSLADLDAHDAFSKYSKNKKEYLASKEAS